MFNKRKSILIAALLVLVSVSTIVAQPVEFIQLPTDNGPMVALGVQNDGEKLISHISGTYLCFSWSETDGFTFLGDSEVHRIADSGRIGGSAWFDIPDDSLDMRSMAYWEDGEWTSLGSVYGYSLDHSISSGFGMNDDGSYIVGYSWKPGLLAEACYWSEETGMQPLNQVNPGMSSRANDVTADGSLIVGWSEAPTGTRKGYRWVRNADSTYTPVFLGAFGSDPAWHNSEPQDISEDGTYVVGSSWTDDAGPAAFFWTEETGIQNISTDIEDVSSSYAYAVSEEGVTVGSFNYYNGGRHTAFIWTEELGTQIFADYLTNIGAQLPEGVHLITAADISRDGRYITGYALSANDEIFTYLVKINIRAPENVTATFIEPDTLHASWEYEAIGDDDELMLEYRYKPIDGEWENYQFASEMLPPTQSSAYVIIEEEGSYQFRIAAVVDGETSYYNESNIVLTYSEPETPQNLSTEIFWDDGYVLISWDDVAEEASYRLESREQNTSGEWLDWGPFAELDRNTTEFVDDEVESGQSYGYRLRAENDLGNSEWIETEVTILTVEKEFSVLPTKTEITGSYPNPFNGTTNVSYNLHKASSVELQLYSVDGRLVETILSESRQPGSYTQVVNLEHRATGTYFLKMQTQTTVSYRKLVLVK